MEPTFWAAWCTASASVMSMTRGTKPSPNSLCKRSASACLRTEPNTRNPFETRTFVVPQPIPVETPVTTTSLLVAIALLLRSITVHLLYLQWLPKAQLKRGSRELVLSPSVCTGGPPELSQMAHIRRFAAAGEDVDSHPLRDAVRRVR